MRLFLQWSSYLSWITIRIQYIVQTVHVQWSLYVSWITIRIQFVVQTVHVLLISRGLQASVLGDLKVLDYVWKYSSDFQFHLKERVSNGGRFDITDADYHHRNLLGPRYFYTKSHQSLCAFHQLLILV